MAVRSCGRRCRAGFSTTNSPGGSAERCGKARGHRAARPLLGLPRGDRDTLCDPCFRWGVVAPRPAVSRRVLTEKRRLLSPVARLSPAPAGEPTPLPPAPSNPSLEPREGFADVVWAQEISEQLPGEQHCPEQAEEGSRGAAGSVCLCQSRFPARPAAPGCQPVPPCFASLPHPNFSRAAGGRSGQRSRCRGALCARGAGRAPGLCLSPTTPGHARLGVGPVGRFTHVLGRARKV